MEGVEDGFASFAKWCWRKAKARKRNIFHLYTGGDVER